MKRNKLKKEQVARALKPRNPIIAALKARQGGTGAGAHGKTRGAQRRAERMALIKQAGGGDVQ